MICYLYLLSAIPEEPKASPVQLHNRKVKASEAVETGVTLAADAAEWMTSSVEQNIYSYGNLNAKSSVRSDIRGGSQADFAPTKLPRFFCITSYRDLAPTEPFSTICCVRVVASRFQHVKI